MIELLNIPHSKNYFHDFLRTFYKVQNCNKNIIIKSHEVYDEVIEFIKNNDTQNITYKISAVLNFNLSNSQIYFEPVWFSKLIFFYKLNPSSLKQLCHDYKKPKKFFEILLGSLQTSDNDIRYNKIFVKKFILENNLDKNNLLKYVEYEGKINLLKNNKKNFDLGFNSEEQDFDNKRTTFDIINYKNINIQISNILPIEIYNQTYYSVIAESRYRNDYTFFTEKTVKPIVAKRLFIAFCGQYYLKNLQSLGFQTFNNIIDESYDSVENDIERWTKASQQMLFLMEKPSKEIVEKIQTVVEFNFKHLKENFLKFNHYF